MRFQIQIWILKTPRARSSRPSDLLDLNRLNLNLKCDGGCRDGIQVLRYQLGQAYVEHTDYFPTNIKPDWNWNPARNGQPP